MYIEFFQLRELPFSITPDPAYLYMSPRHQEALGHLLYGTGQYGGFVQLTGEVGTGKTTIVRTLLEQTLDAVDVAFIHNPRQNEQEFVQTICDELGVTYPREDRSLKTLVDALNEHLLRSHSQGRRTVLIIDEAQNLEPGVLEQVRLLTNLETAKEKLLRIMLIGQPELSALLARPDLRQLASRITARFHLTPLSARETAEYIEHRLRVAGAHGEIFTPQAIAEVHRCTKGVPRLINIVCDRALLGAYAQNSRLVLPDTVRKAAREAMGELPDIFDPKARSRWRLIEIGWAVALLASIGLLIWSFDRHRQSNAEPAAAATKTIPSSTNEIPSAPPTTAPATPPPAPVADPVADVQTLQETAAPLGAVMSRLIRQWDHTLVIPRGENVCSALQKRALDCYRGSGGWDDLRQMNRPAILTLDMPDDGPQYFLLTALDRDSASFDSALGPVRIPLSSLDGVWNGEFLLLWRRSTREDYIDRGTKGPSVAYLWQRISTLQHIAPPAPLPTRFDARLVAALKTFQQAHGLDADGIAGVRTLIALSEGQPNTPTLHSADTEASP
ncbi:ExeA family protein [Solimonas marina]|uniref:AAA family ATPase n=1 Tax=Solimonas marina TaxID=2714601 RepID=A0A969WET2_9GAMM|nr:ExeA family protein [Solimonas marina]NKF24016.1 AAA family ATPase [Solimonas marina]